MTLHLKVTGMHCGHCKTKVERALQAVPGTYAVEVNVQSGDAQVDHDGRTPPETFLQAVQSAGYAARVAD